MGAIFGRRMRGVSHATVALVALLASGGCGDAPLAPDRTVAEAPAVTAGPVLASRPPIDLTQRQLPPVPPREPIAVAVPAGCPHDATARCESCIAKSPIDMETDTIASEPGRATVRVRVRPQYADAGTMRVRVRPIGTAIVEGPAETFLPCTVGQWCETTFVIAGASGTHKVTAGAGERLAPDHQYAVTREVEVVIP